MLFSFTSTICTSTKRSNSYQPVKIRKHLEDMPFGIGGPKKVYLSIYPFCSTLIMSITCSCAVSARVKRKTVGDKKCDSET